MNLLDKYLQIQEEIFDYFGYVEDWSAFPIEDAREYYWSCDRKIVCFADTEEELAAQQGNYYETEVYTYRHIKQYIYEGEDYTMILNDTCTDGNKFLSIFDNDKRRNCDEG